MTARPEVVSSAHREAVRTARSVVVKSRGHFRAAFDEFFPDDRIIEAPRPVRVEAFRDFQCPFADIDVPNFFGPAYFRGKPESACVTK